MDLAKSNATRFLDVLMQDTHLETALKCKRLSLVLGQHVEECEMIFAHYEYFGLQTWTSRIRDNKLLLERIQASQQLNSPAHLIVDTAIESLKNTGTRLENFLSQYLGIEARSPVLMN